MAQKQLDPVSLIRELCATRHAPGYANDPANVEQMWSLSREVITR